MKKAALNVSALKGYRPVRLDRPDLERAAVLIPVLQGSDGDRIIFTARDSQLRFQPGDLCFPGGKAEVGEVDLASCALREAEEEISLSRADVEIIAELDQVTVSSRYLITPFVGLLAPDASLSRSDDEVAALIAIDVINVLDPKRLGTITRVQDASKPTYRFNVGELMIWGATARILKRFLEVAYGAEYPTVSD
jgi:8-oxo-dGTP pyrophosphatase MutT (NUDIX family)